LESAIAERKRLINSNSDTVDIGQLECIEADCNAIRVAIEDLEATARNSFPAFESSNRMWRFVESNTFKGLSKQDAKHIVTYIFDMCSSVKHELDSALTNYETNTKLAIDAAVAKERQLHERNTMKLKVRKHIDLMLFCPFRLLSMEKPSYFSAFNLRWNMVSPLSICWNLHKVQLAPILCK
jgi:hypothetical protein